MPKLISFTKANSKFYNSTAYREMFSDDFAVGWNSMDKHLKFMLPNRTFQHFRNIHPNDLLDNIAVCENKDSSLYFVGYGLSQLYYDEASYGNLVSKYGFELTLKMTKRFPLAIYFYCLQEIARQIIQDDLDITKQQHQFKLDESTQTRLNHQYSYFTLSADPILKKMGSPHGQHQFIRIELLG